MTDKDLTLEVRLQASRALNDELRAENTRLREACEAAIPRLEDYRDFMGRVGADGEPAELAEDGGYSAIAVSDGCQTALDKLTAALAATRPEEDS